MPVRITTWNVNGIRNPFGYQPWREKRTFDAMFDVLEADIVIMQELKIQRKDLRDDMVLVPGWDCYFSLPKHKKGYSGVGIYTRNSVCAPIRAEEGILGVLCPPNSSTPFCEMPEDQHIGGYLSLKQLSTIPVDPASLDAEGRCVVLEFPAFVLFGIYSPANSSGTRDDFRYGFLAALDTRIRNLVKMGKRVIVTGDLNVSREEIDTAKSEEAMRKEGLTYEEYMSSPNRRIFNQLLEGGKVFGVRDEGREEPVMWDICRAFHPKRKGMFTHWEQKINARPGNFGSRIDFILCSLDMKPWFCESNIQEGLMGSDHCPVYAVMKDEVSVLDSSVHLRDVLNPKDSVKDGVVQKAYDAKAVPAFSAKLLPEFDKRQSIKDMFFKKSVPPPMSYEKLDAKSLSNSAEPELDHNDNVQLPDADAPRAAAGNLSVLPIEQSQSHERKRTASETQVTRSLKRVKSASNGSASTTAEKGQRSLKGFFNSKPGSEGSSLADANSVDSEPEEVEKDLPTTPNNRRVSSQKENLISEGFARDNTSSQVTPPASKNAAVTIVSPERFVDPIASKESWAKLFSKPVAPRCEHEEPCKIMKTKVKGVNSGRDFWMCARPLGPSGNKERGTQWRCGTFIWSSQWNGPQDPTTE